MSGRGILIALGIFSVVLVVFLVVDNGKQPATAVPTPSPEASPLLNLTASQVSQVVVKARSKVLTLNHSGKDWSYSLCPSDQGDCPTQTADPTRSQSTIDAILGLRPSRTIFGAPEGLPAYGLDTATTGQIDIKPVNGATVMLLIGARAPDNSSYFARKQGKNDIFAILAATIDSQVFNLLDNPPVPLPSPSPSPSSPIGPAASPAASPS